MPQGAIGTALTQEGFGGFFQTRKVASTFGTAKDRAGGECSVNEGEVESFQAQDRGGREEGRGKVKGMGGEGDTGEGGEGGVGRTEEVAS